MALPALTLPASLPMWLADGYSSQPEALYGHAEMSTGHARTRRRWTSADRREQVSMALTADQLAAWQAWHEDDLEAGLQPFSAQVGNYGPGLVWFEALVLDYTTTPQAGGYTTLTASLLLRGEPSIEGPA